MTNPEQKAKEASELLEEIEDHLKSVEKDITDSWVVEKDTEMREELWYTLRGLQLFKTRIDSVIHNGIKARYEREQNT